MMNIEANDLDKELQRWKKRLEQGHITESIYEEAVRRLLDGALGDRSRKEELVIQKPGDSWVEPYTGMEFIWVKSGTFMMGSEYGQMREKPIHRVELDGFWIGKYQVTQAQWMKVMGSPFAVEQNSNKKVEKSSWWTRIFPENKSINKNTIDHAEEEDFNSQAVEKISWNDAQKFIKKLMELSGKSHAYTLPSEAQWEYVKRSGGVLELYEGLIEGGIAWKGKYDKDRKREPILVGQLPPNNLGVCDMRGNVLEWCQDLFKENAYAMRSENEVTKNPIVSESGGYSKGCHVVRGSSWYIGPDGLRSADRHFNHPDECSHTCGLCRFRLVLSSI